MSLEGSTRSILGPLKFPDTSEKRSLFTFNSAQDRSVCCLLCANNFVLPSKQEELLTHLFLEHQLVIADVDNIACLGSYVDYWRTRFSSMPLKYFCTSMICSIPNEGARQQEYFLLSDVIQEDKLLREGLQRKRLEWVLSLQAKERETLIARSCIFCRSEFTGLRSEYFHHLYEKHNLHLGCPENLVFTDDLLDIIEDKMERLQCIFCDGLFQERSVLKEHMRKKQHKRINPDNKEYDRFYVVNYLEMGKNWQQVQHEPEDTEQLDESSDWSDWQDEEELEPYIVCLFCEDKRQQFEDVLAHMKSAHHFNYADSSQKLLLDFYQQVKLVNYIRRQMYVLHCSVCNQSFTSKQELLQHMEVNDHFRIPDRELWDQPVFYFPTYENDSFLCHLEDNKDEDEQLCDSLMNVQIEDI